MTKNTEFKFYISAKGTFYVDCGENGALSGTGVSGNNTISKSNTNAVTYTCTYNTTGGVKTIQFGGLASDYSISDTTIRFTITPKLVGGISGSLGAIFPTLDSNDDEQQPRFINTFSGCSNMTGTIPSKLFENITGAPVSNMFYYTFNGCSGLSGQIPSGLFGTISGQPAQGMFYGTFQGCSGLSGQIPSGLFGNISGQPVQNMFSATFSGCSGLSGQIPSGLFGNISGTPAQNMFNATFQGCSGLSGQIPSGLFGTPSGTPASSMFFATFQNCSGLSGQIPSGLFGTLSGTPASDMFRQTFHGCSGLSGSIPSGLFGNLSGAASSGNIFYLTFDSCSNLTGYIPSDLFKNVTSYVEAYNAFRSTNLYTTCPCGTRPAATGWGATTVNSKAVCEVGLKFGEHWNNGVCTTDCASGISQLKTSNGLSYPILSSATTDHNIHIQTSDNSVCYVPLATGNASNALKVLLNGTTYHATVPDETVPVGFTGQP